MIADYLLKIFRAAIPHMPKTAAGFGHDLQLALQPMILKPSAGLNVSVLFFLLRGTQLSSLLRVYRRL